MHVPTAPEDAAADKISAACRQIEISETAPSLAALASRCGLSPYHFHRVFKAATGVTPKAYAAAHRSKKLRENLIQAASVTAAIYDSGFNSSGRFYAGTDAALGMTPTAFRNQGAGAKIYFAVGECRLGAILVAQSERGICAISLGDAPEPLVEALQDQFPAATLLGADKKFESTVALVIGLIEAPAQKMTLPLDIRGTAFQQRVWQALQKIPPGQTASYREVARLIGAPGAARAVGAACAANILALAIPCHRVVRTDGSLSGYRWGIARKRDILRQEQNLDP